MTSVALAYALVLARVAAFVTAGPWRYAAPSRLVRLGMVVALSLCWWPDAEELAGAVIPEYPSLGMIVILTVREVIIGVAAGYVAFLFLLPAQFAGDFLGRQMGLSLGQLADPATSSPTTLLAQLFQLIALAIYFGLDVHHAWLLLLDDVVRLWPYGVPAPSDASAYVAALQKSYAAGVGVVGPLVVVGFLIVLGVSLLSKAAPGFQYFSIGLNTQIVGGLVALLLFLPIVCHALTLVAADWMRWAYALFR